MKKNIQDCMTSELLFEALNDNTSDTEKASYLAEYERRLKMMGLTDEQIKKFRECDEKVIKNGCYIKADELLAANPFIKKDMNSNSIKVENCTFSELVYLTDDANYTYITCSNLFLLKIWGLVSKHALNFGICEAAFENKNRMKSIGLTKDQEDMFIKNEGKISKRLRWNLSQEPAWR